MTRHITNKAISVNLDVLAHALSEASILAGGAQAAMYAMENADLAVGTIAPLEQELRACMALISTILALHRRAGQGGAP